MAFGETKMLLDVKIQRILIDYIFLSVINF
jgi:hypothetical protein